MRAASPWAGQVAKAPSPGASSPPLHRSVMPTWSQPGPGRARPGGSLPGLWAATGNWLVLASASTELEPFLSGCFA